ncbi:STAS domain-containing protein [Streptomyces sp. NPDC006367]|uniref:STAS domain-containing protein n=1 Tax=unclassified Streptomyces TaxID=2593676 RepID=UPI0033B84D66
MSLDEVVTPMRGGDAGGGGVPSPAQVDVTTTSEATVLQYEWRGARVVVARGSYDMHSVAPLADALGAAARKYRTVILEASGVEFADSSFLNLLILTHQSTDLRLVAPTLQLRRILELTGVDGILKVCETLEDAVTP